VGDTLTLSISQRPSDIPLARLAVGEPAGVEVDDVITKRPPPDTVGGSSARLRTYTFVLPGVYTFILTYRRPYSTHVLYEKWHTVTVGQE